MRQKNEIKNVSLDRIRGAIAAEKESARTRFRPAAFRARLESRIEQDQARSRSGRILRAGALARLPRRFLLARPLAAAAFAAGFVAVLAALWFFVLSPSQRRATATLHDHILEVLLQSSSSPRPAAGPSEAPSPGAQPIPGVLVEPRPTPDREIPVIVFKVLESLIPNRPAPETPAVEEERASPTPDKLLFHEMLKRIKEA